MENKCDKYEGLFIFSDSENIEKHLQECEDCRKEAEEQKKVSSLLEEVKLYYFAKQKRKTHFRAACAIMFLIFSLFSVFVVIEDEDLYDALKYGNTLSAEDLGFPVDSYGLLMVDEE